MQFVGGDMTRVEVFEQIFIVFLALGTLVGIVVVAYTLYNAYKYRDTEDRADDDDLPTLGELPTGGKGGRKLFVSFGLSALIVISLVIWTYTMLLYVETGPNDEEGPSEDAIEIDVEGEAFSWTFYYENGVESNGELVVPADREIWVNVTSVDVWHAFGVPDQRVKADAIPGEHDVTWFVADPPEDGDRMTIENGVECYELCGDGHSNMKADFTVMEEEAFEEWLAEQEEAMEEDNESEDAADGNESEDDGGDD